MPGTAVWMALVGAAVGMARLGAEGLELAGPPLHPQQNAGLSLAAQLVGLQRDQRRARLSDPAARAAADKPRKKSRRRIAPPRPIASSTCR